MTDKWDEPFARRLLKSKTPAEQEALAVNDNQRIIFIRRRCTVCSQEWDTASVLGHTMHQRALMAERACPQCKRRAAAEKRALRIRKLNQRRQRENEALAADAINRVKGMFEVDRGIVVRVSDVVHSTFTDETRGWGVPPTLTSWEIKNLEKRFRAEKAALRRNCSPAVKRIESSERGRARRLRSKR